MAFLKNNFLLLIFLGSFLGIQAQTQFDVLIFSKTAGWHHQSINDGVSAIRNLAEKHNFNVEWHEDANRINPEFLERFEVVIFLNTTEDILNDTQQKAFEDWYKAGNGFVGIHSAADTEYEWEWYTRLVGRLFYIHPPVVTARINIINKKFPGLENSFDSLLFTDEFYEYSKEITANLNYLISIDESSYDVNVHWDNMDLDDQGNKIPRIGKGMGDFHPLAWFHEFDGGRSFYTGFGHHPKVFEDQFFLNHLYGGIYWAATGKGVVD